MKAVRLTLVAAIAAGVGLFANPAEAAVISVASGDTAALVSALSSAASAGEETTIELAEGTYSIAAAMNANLPKPVTIRGLGAGAVLDAGGASLTVLTVANTAALMISNVTMKGCANGTAFKKTGAGNLTLRNVKISDNIATTTAATAANMTGTAAAELFVYDSEFCGNLTTCGSCGPSAGFLASTFKQVTVDNCRFCRNGEQIGSKTIVNSSSTIGSGATFSDAPFTMTRCTFAGNRPNIHVTAASVLHVKGNCDGSTVKNCSFVANIAPCLDSSNGKGKDVHGAMVVVMDADSRTILIQNCTFAYNCFGERSSPAALNITKGTATVKNCLFHRNFCVGTSAAEKPIDIYCKTIGSSVDYCAFNSLSETSYSSSLSSGGHLHEIADPKLHATDAEFEACVNFSLGAGWPRINTDAKDIDFNNASAMASAAALDVHLTDSDSPALDKGDPADDYSLEPAFNGYCVNLGAYGGTTEAATSLKLDGTVDFTMEKDISSDYTQPHGIVTCTGTGVGYARVFFCYGETAGTADSLASWSEKVLVASGAQRAGDVFDARPMRYFETGTTLHWCVMMVAMGSDDVVKASDVQSDTLTSPMPPWYGVPAQPGVIYVRAGATGRGDGSSWTDAFRTYNEAYAQLDAERGEIWLAGDGVFAPASASASKPGRSLAIRGGFNGSEATAADRVAGTMTDFDVAGGARAFWFEMSAELVIDRINAFGATTAFLTKTGSGAVTLTGCRFAGLKQAGVLNAVSLTGAGTQTATVRDCVFEDNARTDTGSNGGCIRALLIDNYANAVIDGCLFASNGYARTVETAFTSTGGTPGSALRVNNAPVTISNTKFVGNTYCCHVFYSSSILALTGNSAGSSLKNCVFAGNCGLRSDKDEGRKVDLHGVCTVELADDSDAFSVDNCTFFGNVHIEPGSPVALNLRKCLASVRNSIFFCNIQAGTGTKVAADIKTKNAASTVDYCWFADVTSTFVDGFDAIGAHNVTGASPYLVSDTNDFNTVFTSQITTLPYSSGTKPLFRAEPDFNVHLRGRCGYTDEVTKQKVEARMPAGSTLKLSPCVDTGDPSSDFSKEAKPSGGRVNIGAYGNTPWSTVSGTGMGLVLIIR